MKENDLRGKINKFQGRSPGGKRLGAGRPKGSGRYGEETAVLRVPNSLVEEVKVLLEAQSSKISRDFVKQKFPITTEPFLAESSKTSLGSEQEVMAASQIFSPDFGKKQTFPLYASRVAAGFPSPADDYMETKLDLNQYLVKHPAATFFVRVEGESMIGAGIHPNDMLVVDRSLKPSDGKIVIAVVNGELTVKRLKVGKGGVLLMPENPKFSPIRVTEDMNFSIWGVVTNVIHSV